jgi:hypothetical protein
MPSDNGERTADPKSGMTDKQMRMLRLAVIGMGVLLLLGFGLVIGRIVYLLNSPPPGGAAALAKRSPGTAPVNLPLPEGAAVKTMALSGQTLAVQFEGPHGQGIALIDITTGAILQRIELTPSASPKP